MDVNKILQQLREERAQVEEAIITIKRLAVSGHARRRGRPPKWLSEERASQKTEQQSAQSPAKRRGRPPVNEQYQPKAREPGSRRPLYRVGIAI